MTDRPGHHAPIDYHRALIDDALRMDAWERAIRALVRPSDVVLDAGAGTGVLGMLAARRGARVHAVESAASAGLAERLVRANGLQDSVTVHAADLGAIEPIEPCDVVLCDLIGRFLPDAALLGLVRAAARWLRPGGVFAPSRVDLLVAPFGDVRLPEIDRFRTPLLGLDLAAVLPDAENVAYRSQLPATALLGPAQRLATLTPPDLPGSLRGEIEAPIARDGALCGFAGWFEARLAPGVVLDTRPGLVTFWGQTLWAAPRTPVRSGERVTLELEARSEQDAVGFTWTIGAGGASHRFATSGAEAGVARSPAPRLDRAGIITANRTGAEALMAGRLAPAIAAFEDAARSLTREHDDIAPSVWENLGLALYNAARPDAALSPLLRALDGQPASREQALRLLVACLAQLGRTEEAAAALDRYEAAFGPHPFVRR